MSYKTNGSYVLEEMTIVAGDEALDISSMFVSLSLYESMESQSMSGTITVADSYDFQSILKLGGNEEIIIEFYTEGNEGNTLRYSGIIYKISEKHRISDHASGYLIHFCSEIALSSKRGFLSRSVKASISDGVKRILSQYTDKPINVIETSGTYSYCFGNTEALRAINLMMPRAFSTEGDTGYVLYETPNSWNFKPIEYLYRLEPVLSYNTNSSRIYENVDNRMAESFESIQDIRILEDNSYLDSVNDGMFGSKHIIVDLLNKDFSETSFSLENEYNREKSLGNFPVLNSLPPGDDVVFMRYGSGQEDVDNNSVFVRSKMVLRRSDLFRAEINVFGDSSISIGSLLDITFPSLSSSQEEIRNMFDGPVLIKKIHHFLTPNRYLQIMQVNKDAYGELE